jgi:hypothetical protein
MSKSKPSKAVAWTTDGKNPAWSFVSRLMDPQTPKTTPWTVNGTVLVSANQKHIDRPWNLTPNEINALKHPNFEKRLAAYKKQLASQRTTSWNQRQNAARYRRDAALNAKRASARAWDAKMYEARTQQSKAADAARKKARNAALKSELAWTIDTKTEKPIDTKTLIRTNSAQNLHSLPGAMDAESQKYAMDAESQKYASDIIRQYPKKMKFTEKTARHVVTASTNIPENHHEAVIAQLVNPEQRQRLRMKIRLDDSIGAREAARRESRRLFPIVAAMNHFDRKEKKPWKALEGLTIKNAARASAKYKRMGYDVPDKAPPRIRIPLERLQKRDELHAKIPQAVKNAHTNHMVRWWNKRLQYGDGTVFTGRRKQKNIHARESAEQNKRVAARLRNAHAVLSM